MLYTCTHSKSVFLDHLKVKNKHYARSQSVNEISPTALIKVISFCRDSA